MFNWARKSNRNVFLEKISEFVRPELVEALKSPDFNPPLNELRTAKINFLLVAVHGSDPNDIGKNLGVVAGLSRESGWFGDYLFSNFAVLVDGKPYPGAPPSSPRDELVSKISGRLGEKCKSLGGEGIVPWGDYGSPHRKVFGPQLPRFLDLVSQLHRQSFGEHATAQIKP